MTKQGLRMSPFEIERKFIVREIPKNTEIYPAVEILQGYLAVFRTALANDGRKASREETV
jgi:hypothetical protein